MGVFCVLFREKNQILLERVLSAVPSPLPAPAFLKLRTDKRLNSSKCRRCGNGNFCRKSSLNQTMNNGTEYISLDLRHFFEIFVQSVTKLKRCGFTAPVVCFLTTNEELCGGNYFPHCFNAVENKTKFQKEHKKRRHTAVCLRHK